MVQASYARRYWKSVALATVSLVVALHFVNTTRHRMLVSHQYFVSSAVETHDQPHSTSALAFWNDLSKAIEIGRPSFNEVDTGGVDIGWNPFSMEQDAKLYQPQIIQMTHEAVEEMRGKHSNAVATFRQLGPHLPFVRGTRGIIMTAPHNAFGIMITSLRMLRLTGSTLPVEIWMWDRGEFEEKPCDVIFPTFDAKCMFMDDYLPLNPEVHFPPTSRLTFLNKIGAVLFSSFEQVLFLDNDLFPVNNPDSIFTTEPFISSGYVLWPDYWASTSSSQFREISGTEQPLMTERATSESGAMLYNKATHSEALLLSLYYNVYGPKLYYRLISQGGTGEGDKDTWAAAAQVFDLPFYQVTEPPRHIGYRCNGSHPMGTIQSHPLDDFHIIRTGVNRASRNDLFLADAPPPRPLFIHANLPKLDAVWVLNWGKTRANDLGSDLRRCPNDDGGKAHRMWGPKEFTTVRYGWDVEKNVWDSLRWAACTHEHDLFIWVHGALMWGPQTNICETFTSLYEELFPDEIYNGRVPKLGAVKERPWGDLTNH